MSPRVAGLFHDDAVYIVLAKSLAEGTGYTLTSLPSPQAQAKYPFLYPYVLSLIWRLEPSFPDNILLLKLVNFVALFAALLFAWSLHRHYLPDDEVSALVFLFLLGTNINVIAVSRLLMTEALFLALTLCMMWLCTMRLTTRYSSMRVALLALVSASAYLTRTTGIALLVSGMLAMALQAEHRKTILFATLAGAAVSPWIIWQSIHKALPSSSLLHYYVAYDLSSIAYVVLWQDPSRGVNIITGNARYLLESLGTSLLLDVVPGLTFVVYVFVLLGAIRMWRERAALLKLFVLVYVGLILGWPWHPDRFFLPLVPIALLLIFCGIVESNRHLQRFSVRAAGVRRALVLVPLAALSLVHLGWFSGYLSGRIPAPAQRLEVHWPGFVETFAWIREHTTPDAVLASGFDPMYYLYTRRRGVRPWLYRPETYFYPYGRANPQLGEPEEIWRELQRLGVTHLIVDPLETYAEQSAASDLFSQLINIDGSTLKPVFQSSNGLHKVYALPQGATIRAAAREARVLPR